MLLLLACAVGMTACKKDDKDSSTPSSSKGSEIELPMDEF